MRKKLVVIGNGMAAGRVLDELFEQSPDEYAVTVFGAEPRVNYNRIMLSPVLAGEKAFSDIVIHDEAWYEANGVALRRGVFVDSAVFTGNASAVTVSPADDRTGWSVSLRTAF